MQAGGDSATAAWEYLLPRTGETSGRAASSLLTAAAGPDGEAQTPVPPERTRKLVSDVTSAVGNSVVEVLLTAAYRRGMPFHFIDPVFLYLTVVYGQSEFFPFEIYSFYIFQFFLE